MQITESFYAPSRKQWRAWLKKHHKIKKEIWLIYYKKDSGKPRVPYNDAVEEALCFGWIDSTVKTVDKDSYAQRFSKRNPKSEWSEPNLERVRFLTKSGLMTKAGLDILHQSEHKHRLKRKPVIVAADIQKALKKAAAWNYYLKFPEGYRRIRIGWIDAARHRPEVFKQRLDYFVKKTAKNERFGMLERK